MILSMRDLQIAQKVFQLKKKCVNLVRYCNSFDKMGKTVLKNLTFSTDHYTSECIHNWNANRFSSQLVLEIAQIDLLAQQLSFNTGLHRTTTSAASNGWLQNAITKIGKLPGFCKATGNTASLWLVWTERSFRFCATVKCHFSFGNLE